MYTRLSASSLVLGRYLEPLDWPTTLSRVRAVPGPRGMAGSYQAPAGNGDGQFIFRDRYQDRGPHGHNGVHKGLWADFITVGGYGTAADAMWPRSF